MKANGASASRRFSARLKCTRPTRFQAGLRRLRKVWRSVPAASNDAAAARCQRLPQAAQHVGRQVFRACHHRRREHQPGEVAIAGRRNLQR